MRRVTQARWWLLFGWLLCLPFAQARSHDTPDAAVIPTVSVAALPSEARNTLRHIKNNGPFPYPRDGVVFGNYEQILPQRAHGYYHEYTVKTPKAQNRGARRIVCGIVPECYYSADHYRTFKHIREGN